MHLPIFQTLTLFSPSEKQAMSQKNSGGSQAVPARTSGNYKFAENEFFLKSM